MAESAERIAAERGAPVFEVDGRKLSPMLCAQDATAGQLLDEAGWLFELKLDGVRIVADKRGDAVGLFYRKARETTTSYPEIAEAVRGLAPVRVVLDGEIVAFDEAGRPDFQRLGHRIQTLSSRGAQRAAAAVPVVYVVFDVLAVGDRDLRGLPIEARKAVLDAIVPAAFGLVRRHPTFEAGRELFRLCREHRLEGVVAKRKGSTYRAGERASDWVKIKCEMDADFVVVGFTEGEGRRSRLGALDLASYDNGRLVVRGRVGSGLDEATIDALLARLEPLVVDGPVAEGKYERKKVRHHVRPEVVVSVQYMGFSADGSLRFAVFRGLREDVRPEDCTLLPASVAPPTARIDEPGERVRRIHLKATNKPVLPDGTTKGELCAYYERVAPALLRFAAKRPCALVRPDPDAPLGLSAMWPLPRWTPSWVRPASIGRGARGAKAGSAAEVHGVFVDDADTLAFALEAGCVSVVLPPVREDAPDACDFVALRVRGRAERGGDLGDAAVVAELARAVFARIGLPAFAKSGGTEVDVLAAAGGAPRQAARALVALVAQLAARELGLASAESLVLQPREVVVAPWAIDVARGGSLPSVPLTWEELAALAAEPLPRSLLSRADAERRALSGHDPLLPLLEARVDIAQAVAALERELARAGLTRGVRERA